VLHETWTASRPLHCTKSAASDKGLGSPTHSFALGGPLAPTITLPAAMRSRPNQRQPRGPQRYAEESTPENDVRARRRQDAGNRMALAEDRRGMMARRVCCAHRSSATTPPAGFPILTTRPTKGSISNVIPAKAGNSYLYDYVGNRSLEYRVYAGRTGLCRLKAVLQTGIAAAEFPGIETRTPAFGLTHGSWRRAGVASNGPD